MHPDPPCVPTVCPLGALPAPRRPSWRPPPPAEAAPTHSCSSPRPLSWASWVWSPSAGPRRASLPGREPPPPRSSRPFRVWGRKSLLHGGGETDNTEDATKMHFAGWQGRGWRGGGVRARKRQPGNRTSLRFAFTKTHFSSRENVPRQHRAGQGASHPPRRGGRRSARRVCFGPGGSPDQRCEPRCPHPLVTLAPCPTSSRSPPPARGRGFGGPPPRPSPSWHGLP